MSKAVMERSFSEKLQLDELASAAFMSRFHFVRLFQRIYGLTPRVFLRDLRITKAKQLILEGGPVTQVCLEVGYESLPTFSSVFKKCVGYTLTDFFRSNKSNLE